MITIYSKTGCPFCDMAKDWFKSNKLEFKEVLIDDNKERSKFYESLGPDVKTVPQIFIDGERIGGFDNLMKRKEEVLARLNITFTEEF